MREAEKGREEICRLLGVERRECVPLGVNGIQQIKTVAAPISIPFFFLFILFLFVSLNIFFLSEKKTTITQAQVANLRSEP